MKDNPISEPKFVQNAEFDERIEALRNQIDTIDHEILTLIAERMKVSLKIGHEKSVYNITVFQKERWAQMYDDRLKILTRSGLSVEFSENFLKILHTESIRQQVEVIKKIQAKANEDGHPTLQYYEKISVTQSDFAFLHICTKH